MIPAQERRELYQRWEVIVRNMVELESRRHEYEPAAYSREFHELRETLDELEQQLRTLWEEHKPPSP